MNRLIPLLLLISILFGQYAHAELVLIANKKIELDELSKKQVIDIYMGRYTSFPNGQKVIPLDQAKDSQARVDFYRKLVDKSLNEINSYWARLLFSGRATPPRALDNAEEVIEMVSANPSAIGYILTGDVKPTDNVKVLSYID